MKSKYRKGMHLIAKYEGDNGDLVVGRIESVRTNGDIIGTNLLTGSRFTKSTHVINKRNVTCSKAIAVAILEASGSDKKLARQEAVTFARLLNGKGEEKEKKTSRADERKINRAIKLLSKLTQEQRQEVLKRVFPEAAKVFH